MKILIIKLGAIGDVMRTTSLLPGLREKYKTAAIDWLTSAAAKDLLLHNKYINNLLVWPEYELKQQYDLVIGLEDELKVCDFVAQVKAERIVGAYAKEGKQFYTPSAWFDMSAISKYGLEKANQLKAENKKTYQQHMADLLNIKVSPYVFELTNEEIEYGRKYVKGLGIGSGEKVIGINTGAGSRWQLKALSIEKTIELVKRFTNELGVVSLILGGPEEKERNEIICKETGMPNGGQHSLRNFAGVVNQCSSMISSDSLAMHFAIALKKRLVVFFGPTSASEIELYGLGTKVCPRMDCLVCYKKTCDLTPNCMDLLSVEDLLSFVL